MYMNSKKDCMLCDMEKKTHWYYEDEKIIIAEKLGGGPFVVWKDHTKKIDSEEREYVTEHVEDVFGPHELTVKMNLVTDHWHAHIRPYGKNPGQNLPTREEFRKALKGE